MKRLKKPKWYTQEEANRIAAQREREQHSHDSHMVGSHYYGEEYGSTGSGKWVVSHYVLGQLTRQEFKNGYVPHDYFILEGENWDMKEFDY